jgi:hypothetical protein
MGRPLYQCAGIAKLPVDLIAVALEPGEGRAMMPP